MNGLTMSPCPLPPVPYGSFVNSKAFDDGLDWAAIGQQHHHPHDRLWSGPQPIEECTFGCAKSFLAYIANVALILLAMDADVAFSGLTPCRAGDIRAKYLVGVHWPLSWFARQASLPSNPYFCKDLPDTTFRWSGTVNRFSTIFPQIISSPTSISVR
jgi:hypothetical protein